jgi:hypothetical protein
MRASFSILLVLLTSASLLIAGTNGFAGVCVPVTRIPTITTRTHLVDTIISSTRLQALSNDDHHNHKDNQEATTNTRPKKNHHHHTSSSLLQSRIGSTLVATALLLGSTFTNILPASHPLGIPPAFAEGGSKVVGALKGSGLVFKDTLQIERFEGAYSYYIYCCYLFWFWI